MKRIVDGSGVATYIEDFDVEATNALANSMQAQAALDSVKLMKEQLESSKRENKRMFIIALMSSLIAFMSSLPELLLMINTLFFKAQG